jgi:hypothetical protein
MKLRHQTDDAIADPVAADGDDGPDHTELRERGAALLAAADEAISRALSRDSAEFLAQNRQAGGE